MDSLSCSWIVTLSLFQLVVVAFRVRPALPCEGAFSAIPRRITVSGGSPPVEGPADDRLY
jgi:hypothetical protein